jgi:membrane protein implicated in regulation of membrane protease activity
MTEIFRIFATSWPLAFMVVAICIILLLLRVVKWREREGQEERVFKSDAALVARFRENLGLPRRAPPAGED